ncbi:hypothetical protein Tco_0312607 [Tanacetum coccineum]
MDVENNLNRLQEMLNLINSNQDPPVDLYHLEGSDKGDSKIDSLTKEPLDTLLMWDEIISTTPARENDEFIKSSVDDHVPIPRESDMTSVCDDLECDMPVNTPFPTTDVLGDAIVDIDLPLEEHLDTLSTGDREVDLNPSRDIEELERLLADDPVLVQRVFDEPLEVLENIKSKDSYVSNLNEPALLVTPLSDANKGECFNPEGVIDEIDAFLDMDISTDIGNGYHDSEGDIIYLESLLIDDTSPNLLPGVFLNHDPRSLKDEHDNDDLMTENKIFDPLIHEKSFSPTFVKLTFEDRHYLPITFVIRIFLPYLTYSVDSSFLLSSGSEDTIFDPGISAFHFSSLKPVAYENPIVIFLFFCFCPKDKGIRGEIPQDHEDPCLFSILQSSGLRSSAYFGILIPDLIYIFVYPFTLGIFCICLFPSADSATVFQPSKGPRYKGLKTKQKRYEEGSGSTRVVRRLVDRDILQLATVDFEDISSLDPPESTPVIDESTFLVTPLPDSKKFSLGEVKRFDPFFSLTQSGGTKRVMETSSLGFHHMPSPRPAAYSPKEDSL